MKKCISLISVVLSFWSFSTLVQAFDFPHIETSGYGEITAKPDMAVFTVRVEQSTLTAQDAKNKVDTVVENFIKRLVDTGVSRDDISATNINLAPRYNYPKTGVSELVGYQASRRITVTVSELDKLNVYLDGAIGDGISRIDNITLKVKDQKKYKQLARLAAIEDANEKAQALAEGFDLDIDGVWRIAYNNSHSAPPAMMKTMAMDSRSESAGYEDTTLIIRDSVSVVYKLTD